MLALMQALGVPECGDDMELSVLPEDRIALQAHPIPGSALATDRPLVAIHPGVKVATRRWPLERFAVVADYLINNYDVRVLITGGKQE